MSSKFQHKCHSCEHYKGMFTEQCDDCEGFCWYTPKKEDSKDD
jgi:hypothetical protein